MFSRLKIATKLLIGFGAILLLLVGISGLAAVSTMRAKDSLEAVTKLKGAEVLQQRVEKRVFEARMHFWIALESGDQKHWNKSSEGFAVADEWLNDLLAETPELKVIYMSGYSPDITLSDLHLGQGIHFLAKPFDTFALAKTVRAALETA